jgi:putative endonuclease
MSHYRILDTKIMARYAYNALENALYYAMRDIDESRKTEIIYPLQKDILESTKDSKELMRSFLMDTDYTKDLDDVDEDSSNTLASLVLTKEKKVGYIIYIDLPVEKTFYTYILRCNDNTLYTGWTNDLEKRLYAHNSGKGAKYTKARLPVEMVYYKASESKEEAMRLEWKIKQLSRSEKIKLINNEVEL